MNDEHNDRFVEQLKTAASDYNAPPETPRDRMWAQIDAARVDTRGKNSENIVDARSRFRKRSMLMGMSAAAVTAAVLLIGFAIGRYTAVPPEDTASFPQQDSTNIVDILDPPSGRGSATTNIYQLAAAPVIDKAEILLTHFNSGADADYADRASSLLADTRLLLNSPAADDPAMGKLLGDLELILAQIVNLSDDRVDEKEWIEESIDDRSLLPRLRTSTNTNANTMFNFE